MSVINDIKLFDAKVSEFSGKESGEHIAKYWENPRDTSKSFKYIFNKTIPIEEKSFNRGVSNKVFTKKLKLDDLSSLLAGALDFPIPGGIEVLHGYILANTEEFSGIIYTDFSELKIVSEQDVLPILKYIYEDGVGVDLSTISFSLFLFGELPKLADKYKHLSYDYFMMQGGMLIQNMYVRSEELDIKKTALGCYSKKKALESFSLDENYLAITNLIFGL